MLYGTPRSLKVSILDHNNDKDFDISIINLELINHIYEIDIRLDEVYTVVILTSFGNNWIKLQQLINEKYKRWESKRDEIHSCLT